MSRMAAVECYQMYMALKMHFESKSYDYFKYHGKVKMQNFNVRRDKYQFQKLCRMVEEHDMKDFLVANFAMREKIWVGDLLTDEAMDCFLNFRRYIENFPYQYNEDIDKLLQSVQTTPDEIFKKQANSYPIIIKNVMSGNISIITYIILDNILGFGKNINKRIEDDIVWPKVNQTITKLKPFIKVNKKLAKTIILEKIHPWIDKYS